MACSDAEDEFVEFLATEDVDVVACVWATPTTPVVSTLPVGHIFNGS